MDKGGHRLEVGERMGQSAHDMYHRMDFLERSVHGDKVPPKSEESDLLCGHFDCHCMLCRRYLQLFRDRGGCKFSSAGVAMMLAWILRHSSLL